MTLSHDLHFYLKSEKGTRCIRETDLFEVSYRTYLAAILQYAIRVNKLEN